MVFMPKRIQRRKAILENKPPPAITFDQAVKDFLPYYKCLVSEGTVADFHWAWKQLNPSFGHIQIPKLTPANIESYKNKRLGDGVKKSTVNRELSYIASIIKWAENNDIIWPLPFRVKRFPKRDVRGPEPVVHTLNEMAAIIDHLKPRHRGMVLLMYDAGLRKSEAMNLTGDRIDIELRQIRVRGKGSKDRIVPIITNRLYEEMVAAKERAGTGYLYINPRTNKPYKDIKTAMRTASKKAGVDKKIYHHLLRHDHGTHTAIAGVDCRAIQKILGHSSLSTTEIYTHLAGDFLRSEGKKFAELLERNQALIAPQ